MNRNFIRLWLLPLFLVGTVLAEPPAKPDPSQLDGPGSTVTLPGLVVHGGPDKHIVAEGAVSLTTGILEFVTVEVGGRDYESLLTLNCKPSALQFALLLIGCEPGPLPRLAKDGERPGSRLRMELQWSVDGTPRRVPLAQLLVDRKTQQPLQDAQWIFTGSYFGKSEFGEGDAFMSDIEQAHIALWWTRSVLINIGGDHGNPYQEDDQGLEANSKLMPPAKTPVQLIIRKHE